LVQAALVGLVKAVDRFDPGRGVVFSTFAVPTIMGELRRHFRDKTWLVHVPRRGKDLYTAVGAVVDELTAALGRSPSVAEIAERADLTIEEALEALEMRSCYRGLPLEPRDEDDPPADVALSEIDSGFDGGGPQCGVVAAAHPADESRQARDQAEVPAQSHPVGDRRSYRRQPGAGVAITASKSRARAAAATQHCQVGRAAATVRPLTPRE
jgi:hypothetical protein